MNTSRLTRLAPILAASALSWLAIPSAQAHIDVNYPLHANSNQKTGPCGNGDFEQGTVTTLAPGSALAIQIKETVGHPGHFRVMFDPDTTNGLDFPPQAACDELLAVDGLTVLADGLIPASGPVGSSCYDFHLPSERNPVSGTDYTLNVTLPDMECENCAIQVTQVMTDISKQDLDGNWDPTGGKGIYFRCSKVRLSNDAPATPDAGVGPGDPLDAGGANPSDPDAGTGPEGTEPVNGGGCSTGGTSGGAGLLLLALGFLTMRRRQED